MKEQSIEFINDWWSGLDELDRKEIYREIQLNTLAMLKKCVAELQKYENPKNFLSRTQLDALELIALAEKGA